MSSPVNSSNLISRGLGVTRAGERDVLRVLPDNKRTHQGAAEEEIHGMIFLRPFAGKKHSLLDVLCQESGASLRPDS